MVSLGFGAQATLCPPLAWMKLRFESTLKCKETMSVLMCLPNSHEPSLSPSEGEVQPAQAKKPRTTEGSAGSFILISRPQSIRFLRIIQRLNWEYIGFDEL